MTIQTIKDLLETSTNQYSDVPVFEYTKKKEQFTITRPVFQSQVFSLTNFLLGNDVHGERIALLGENCYEWIVGFFGITVSGNYAVLLDKGATLEAQKFMMEDSECGYIFYSKEYEDIALELKTSFPRVKLTCFDEFAEIFEKEKDAAPQVDLKSTDLAAILFTSGSTGRSKAVQLSHKNLLSNVLYSPDMLPLDDKSLLVLPLHHAYGLTGAMLAPIYYGGTITICMSMKRIMMDLERTSPRYCFMAPIMVNMVTKLFAYPKEVVIQKLGGNLHQIVTGGAPMSAATVTAFEEYGITLLNGYGITECSPVVTCSKMKCNIPGSVGLPLQCNEIKIKPDGEILVKGDGVFMGYMNNDKANSEAFENGWFRTGDLGSFGEKGELYITGRIKNLIILSNGENIPAEPLEELIYTIPYVKEVKVYGKDDSVFAEVFFDPDLDGNEAQLKEDIDKINMTLPPSHCIQSFAIRDTEFPKTSSGKIKR